MDKYLPVALSNLKLAEQALTLRVAYWENQPVGIVSRENILAHSRAVLAAVRHARFIARTRPDGWWDEDEQVPF